MAPFYLSEINHDKLLVINHIEQLHFNYITKFLFPIGFAVDADVDIFKLDDSL